MFNILESEFDMLVLDCTYFAGCNAGSGRRTGVYPINWNSRRSGVARSYEARWFNISVMGRNSATELTSFYLYLLCVLLEVGDIHQLLCALLERNCTL